jgi:TRAP-type C4-dicarboxylate transport system substrate-binding protein
MSIFSDETLLEYLRGLYADANLYHCAVTFQGFRTLTSNVEIHTLADCKGLDIRVVESPTPIALWTALGANPTPLAFSEVYTALQQGVVDAQENPTELIYSQKF